jgi:hypothetical protein
MRRTKSFKKRVLLFWTGPKSILSVTERFEIHTSIIVNTGEVKIFAQTFGHGTLRKYVVFFGTLFNSIFIQRYDKTGALTQTSKVPLNYGPRDKFLARLEGNSDLDRPIAIQLPRMTFEMTGLYYDPARKLNALNRYTAPVPGTPDTVRWQYQPVPYNIDFTLSIMVKNIEDGTFIVEQILPFFNPVFTATLNVNTDLQQRHDIPITLDNIVQEDTYEGNFETRRAIIWTLNFTMKAWFFGPTKQDSGLIIREIDVNLRTPGFGLSIPQSNSTNTDSILNVDIRPGQTANGEPLTYYENTRLYTYTLTDATGSFEPTEKVYVDGDNFVYVASANTTEMSARRIIGTVSNGDTVVGVTTGHTATITSISVVPEDSVNNSSVAIDSDYGFIYDITENL